MYGVLIVLCLVSVVLRGLVGSVLLVLFAWAADLEGHGCIGVEEVM